jgi:hypothetical protein
VANLYAWALFNSRLSKFRFGLSTIDLISVTGENARKSFELDRKFWASSPLQCDCESRTELTPLARIGERKTRRSNKRAGHTANIVNVVTFVEKAVF